MSSIAFCSHIAQLFALMATFLFLQISLGRLSPKRYENPFDVLTTFPRPCSKCGSMFTPLYLSILAVSKNEGPYLAEWIEFHFLIGVDRIYLVLNDNEDNSTEVVQPYVSMGFVALSYCNGPAQQVPIYNAYVPRLRNISCWVAIIDVDEFLVPTKGRSVPEILRPVESASGMLLYELVFGTNGKMKQEPGLVMERFPLHTQFTLQRNCLMKAIVNPRKTTGCHIHYHFYAKGELPVNAKGRPAKGLCQDGPAVFDPLRINHYWTKSVEEFRNKKLRGVAFVSGARVIPTTLSRLRGEIREARDVVANDTGVDWAIPLVKENMAKRRRA
jgi:hypothetical protein